MSAYFGTKNSLGVGEVAGEMHLGLVGVRALLGRRNGEKPNMSKKASTEFRLPA